MSRYGVMSPRVRVDHGVIARETPGDTSVDRVSSRERRPIDRVGANGAADDRTPVYPSCRVNGAPGVAHAVSLYLIHCTRIRTLE